MTGTRQPVKKPRKDYIDIGNTGFKYRFENDVLVFRPVKNGVAPIQVNRETLCKLLEFGESGLTNYLQNAYEFPNSRWLVKKLIMLVKSGTISFFDIDISNLKNNVEFVYNPKSYPPILRKQYAEPEINKKIREALRRTSPKNRSD